MSEPLMILVAGPYRSGTNDDPKLIRANVDAMTDTALKLFRTPLIQSLPLVTSGFELDHEITSRLLSRGHTIREVPIRYFPRTKAEGKKIVLRDWFIGTRTFWRFRNG